MKAYEGGSAAYFATPPVNLIYAYHESLSQITKASLCLDERLKRHRETSSRIKTAATELGLTQLPLRPEISANGMTAVSCYWCLNFISETHDLRCVAFFSLAIALVPRRRKVVRAFTRLLTKGRHCCRWPRN